MLFGDTVTLENARVRLEPLSPDHAEGLAAACRDLSPLWYTSSPTPDTIGDDIAQRLALRDAGSMNPWVVVHEGAVVGETTFCNIDQTHRHVEVGHTWLAPSAQGTRVNPAAKRLLLTHAFETCDAIAVELRTHWHNQRSRAAIERLGAKLDGVLRNHRIGPDGILRDTMSYSILPSEWPAVRRGLDDRLTARTA